MVNWMKKYEKETDIEKKIADTLHELICYKNYSKIKVEDIVESIPISRRTFYNYFHDKDEVIQYIITKQFMENAFPVCKAGFGKKGLIAFFRYIFEDKEFYLSIARYDNGHLLQDALIHTYGQAVNRVKEYAHPVENREKRINPQIYMVYTHSALAATIVYWLKDGLKISVEDIARDAALMLEHSHSFVRDRYLL